jgi:hypothetical protein
VTARRVPLSLATGLLLAVLGGCTDAGGSSGEPSASVSSKAEIDRRLEVSGATPFAKEGTDFRVVGETPAVIDGRMAFYRGTASNGTEVLVKSDIGPPSTGSTPDPRGNALILRDPDTGSIKTVSQPGTRDRWLQIVDVIVAGDQVVWTDTPSRSLYELPWAMHTYDIATGKSKQLASSDDFGIENPPLPGLKGVVPHVTEGYAYFPAVDEVKKSDPEGYGRALIYRVPLKGGDLELVAKGANEVYGDGDPSKIQVRFSGERIVQWNPAKGPDGEVRGTSVPAPEEAFANDGTLVTADSSAGVQVDSVKNGRFTVKLPKGARGYYLNATDRWVSFTVDRNSEQKGYLLDMQRGKLTMLKGVWNASTVRSHGNLIDVPLDWEAELPKSFPLIALLPE